MRRCFTNWLSILTSSPELRKWESSEGSDPYSYGYNRDTPYEDYRNATYILHSLVDIVSKNGNYLIDIGPKANGTVVPPSRSSLLKVGEWLKIGCVGMRAVLFSSWS